MGKAEERNRLDRIGLLPESVSEYGLRGCPQLSDEIRMAVGFFVCIFGAHRGILNLK